MPFTTLVAVLLLALSPPPTPWAPGAAAPIAAAPAQLPETSATVTIAAPIFLLPDATRQPLRVAAVGTTLNVLKEEGEWAQVEFEDPQFGRRQGWVQTTFIQMSRPDLKPVDLSVKRDPVVTRPPVSIPPRIEPDKALEQLPSMKGSRPKNIKIRGYVTQVVSPTEFEIEDYRITRDMAFVLDLENTDPALKFNPEDIRIGVELEIRGLFSEVTGELKATSIKVDMEQFKRMKQTAVIARPPSGLELVNGGWKGEFFVDGQRVVVSPTTQVVYKLTSREKNAAKKNEQGGAAGEFRPLLSLDQIGVGTAMSYEGQRRVSDGAIAATRIEVVNNDLEDGEAKLWKSLKVSATPAQGFTPGELKIDKVGKFKLLPNDDVQRYVTQLGSQLVPVHQRDLPEGTPNKIPFRFYVVKDDAANAFALPNGIVVINSGLIEILQNEAQLAAVVGHEVAHSVQEHTWRQMQYHKKKRIGLAIAGAVAAAYGQYDLSNLVNMVQSAIQSGHSRSLENQADRLGLEYMVAAGYDPREAPRVWKLMTKKYGLQQTDFFWSSHENQATRRSYLMNELKNNYRELDYAALTVREDEFKRTQELVRAAANDKVRVRVK